MKKYITFSIITIMIIVFFACNNTSINQQPQQIEANIEAYKTSDSAVLYYANRHIDIDTIVVGEKNSYAFTYTNKGKAPLVVSSVFTTCGCVQLYWNKEPLMPNQSDTIKFDITIKSPGFFQKAIVVKNNSINEPVMTIRVEGYAKEKS